jgi:hypothetical protein
MMRFGCSATNVAMNSVHYVPLARLVSLASLITLSACNGYYNNPYYGQSAGPCTYLNAKLALIAPAPGATGVPDAFSQVIFASSVSFPNSYDVVVKGAPVGQTTRQVGFGRLVPASLPAGATAPSFPNPIYYASANPGITFAAATTVSVALNDEGSPNCSPGSSIGSFTVQ